MDRNQPKTSNQVKKDYEYGGNEEQRYNNFKSIVDLLQRNDDKKEIIGDLEFPEAPVEEDEDEYDDDDEIVEEAPKNNKKNTAYNLEGLHDSQANIEKFINDGKFAFDRFGLTTVDLHKKENASYILADPRYLSGEKYATFSDFYRLEKNSNGQYTINKIGFDEVVSTFKPDYEHANSTLRGLLEKEVKKKVFGFNNIDVKGSAYLDEKGQKQYHSKEDDIAEKYKDNPHYNAAKRKAYGTGGKNDQVIDDANSKSAERNYKAFADGAIYNEFVKFAKKNGTGLEGIKEEEFYDNLKMEVGDKAIGVGIPEGKLLFVDPRVTTNRKDASVDPYSKDAVFCIATRKSPTAQPKIERVTLDKAMEYIKEPQGKGNGWFIPKPKRGFFGTIADFFTKNTEGRKKYEREKEVYIAQRCDVLREKFNIKGLNYVAPLVNRSTAMSYINGEQNALDDIARFKAFPTENTVSEKILDDENEFELIPQERKPAPTTREMRDRAAADTLDYLKTLEGEGIKEGAERIEEFIKEDMVKYSDAEDAPLYPSAESELLSNILANARGVIRIDSVHGKENDTNINNDPYLKNIENLCAAFGQKNFSYESIKSLVNMYFDNEKSKFSTISEEFKQKEFAQNGPGMN